MNENERNGFMTMASYYSSNLKVHSIILSLLLLPYFDSIQFIMVLQLHLPVMWIDRCCRTQQGHYTAAHANRTAWYVFNIAHH